MDETRLVAMKDRIEDVELPDILDLPFEFFERPSSRTTQLVAVSDSARPVEGKSRWYAFQFRSPVFVTDVVVDASGYGESDEFAFEFEGPSRGVIQFRDKPDAEGCAVFIVNELCSQIRFRPPPIYFRNPKINSVRVLGIKSGEISPFLEAVGDIETTKAEAVSYVEQEAEKARALIESSKQALLERSAIQREVDNLKNQISRSKKTVEDLNLKKTQMIAENAASEKAISELKSRAAELESRVQHTQEGLSRLEGDRKRLTQELKSLRENINLFPTEIVEFVNQGSHNIWQYFWLAIIPLFVTLLLTILLVSGAVDLTNLVTEQKNVNITALLLSRVPYVTVSLAIITACYKITINFFREIVRINNQRLNLTKISIIAKDVSHAAESNLNLSDQDIYRLRTDLKMQLLRDHLKEYLSSDFRLSGAIPPRLMPQAPPSPMSP